MKNRQKKNKETLSKKKPEKKLLVPLKKKGGRNNQGKITVRHRGGGAKRLYRLVDFGEKEAPFEAKVEAIEYDPNRTARIALISSEKFGKKYILAPQELKVGDKVVYGEKAPISVGNRLKLKNIPIGTFVYNIELQPMTKGRIGRSAGTAAQVMGQEGKYVVLKMPSTEIRKVLGECFASVGELSNSHHRFEAIGKAGRARLMGKRPTVRGSAMNAVDHPHGGGRGKTGIGLKHPKTPWGKAALGVRTRKKKKWSNKLIIKRRKNKKKKR